MWVVEILLCEVRSYFIKYVRSDYQIKWDLF